MCHLLKQAIAKLRIKGWGNILSIFSGRNCEVTGQKDMYTGWGKELGPLTESEIYTVLFNSQHIPKR